MKLKAYTPEVINPFTRNNSIHIGLHYTGRILLSKGLTDLMGLKAGDNITIFQDEEEPTDWYLAKTKKGGFPVSGRGGKHSYYLNSSEMVRKIFGSLNYRELSGSMFVGAEPVEANIFPMITSSLKKTKRNA